jgi:hypothetical protein
MTAPDTGCAALESALLESKSRDGLIRAAAIQKLSRFIQDRIAVARLYEMLNDDVVTMQVDAADVLVRLGGVRGIILVLNEIGRRGDPDADYIANRLYELDAAGDVEILAMIGPISDSLSNEGLAGFRQLKTLRGRE